MPPAFQAFSTHFPQTDLTLPTVVGPAFAGSAFAVQELAETSVGAAAAAAAALASQRGHSASELPHVLDRVQVMTSFSGHVSVDGQRPPVWSDLSGMYEAANGRFVQLHCNFPHHAAGVVAHLGVAAEREAVAAAITERDAFELEAELIDRGMIAAACRTLAEWEKHPHALATSDLPLLELTRIGDAPPRALGRGSFSNRALSNRVPAKAGERGPAEGVRVVDCSRVLAGPVCGQTLASVGADVLRVGAPHLPAVDMAVMSTGFGKRNTFIDLDQAEGQRVMTDLLRDADVVVDAYRPGALAARGLTPEHVAAICPGSVLVQICAFDWTGPWAGRRGFDSIVQSTTGIVMAGAEAAGVAAPTPLPVQALDYATGYLASAAAMAALAHQQREGGSWLVRLSLLRTRNWLLSLGGPTPFMPGPLPDPSPWLYTVDSDFGVIEAPAPILGLWPNPPARLGTSQPEWKPRN